MKTVKINRFPSDKKQTLGNLMILDLEFTCKTLELTWKDNLNSVSCIPVGSYLCRWTRSNRLSKEAGHSVFTYEVIDVPGRSGIRIHSANFFFQLLGCIALGDAHKDINIDQQLDVVHSGKTVKKFNELMNKEDFLLEIV